MPILVFAHQRIQGLGVKIKTAIRQVAPDVQVDLRTTAGVFHALSQPLAQNTYPMVILIIDKSSLLDHFIKNRHVLDGHRIFLVLPDCSLKTVEKAHQLYPRFITYVDSDFREITDIVQKWRQSVSEQKTKAPERERENAKEPASTKPCQ